MKYNVTVYYTFYDKLNEEWIQNANCSIYFNGEYYWNHTGDVQGIYSWEIPTYNVNGTFVVNITMNKTNWANVSYSFITQNRTSCLGYGFVPINGRTKC